MKRTLAITLALAALSDLAQAQSVYGSSYTQNFDGMSALAVPTGWTIDTKAGNNQGSVDVSATSLTSSSSGSAYKFTSGSDNAIGFLSSGSFNVSGGKAITFTLTNTTGQTASKVVVEWNYEKYRDGARAWNWTFSAGGTTQADGAQSYAATSNGSGIFPPQSTAKSVTVTGANIANNGTYALKWTLSSNGSTNGQALAIDDLNVYLGVPQLYWDGNGSGTVSGGSGTWSLSGGAVTGTANWSGTSGGSSYGKWNNTAHDNTTANFGGTGGAVALGSAITTGGMNFTAGGYSITGSGANTLTLAGTTPTVTVGAGLSTSISAKITGSSSLTKSGAGTLILSGANDYTGETRISAGTVTAGSATTLQGASGKITVSGTGTLSSTGDTTFGGNLALNAGGTLDPNGADAGAFALASNKNFLMDGGTWNLSILAASSFDKITGGGTGTFAISGGVLDLTGSTLSAGSYDILSGFASGSGNFSSITGYDEGLFDITFSTASGSGTLNITAVPEPHEVAMAVCGLLGLAIFSHRRRKWVA